MRYLCLDHRQKVTQHGAQRRPGEFTTIGRCYPRVSATCSFESSRAIHLAAAGLRAHSGLEYLLRGLKHLSFLVPWRKCDRARARGVKSRACSHVWATKTAFPHLRVRRSLPPSLPRGGRASGGSRQDHDLEWMKSAGDKALPYWL